MFNKKSAFYVLTVILVWSNVKSADLVMTELNKILNFDEIMGKCFLNWRFFHVAENKLTNDQKIIIADVKKVLAAIIKDSGFGDKKVKDSNKSLRHDQLEAIADYIWRSYFPVPYHNICHAIYVAKTTAQLLSASIINNKINNGKQVQDQLLAYDVEFKQSLVFAALMHDIFHNGYGNPYCPSVKTEEVVIYDNAESQKDKVKEKVIHKYTKNQFCLLKFTPEKTCIMNDVDEIEGEYFNLKWGKHEYLSTYEEVKRRFHQFFEANPAIPNEEIKGYTGQIVKATPLTFDGAYCNTAELQHVIITYKVIKDFEFTNERINLILGAIFATNMRAYVTDFTGLGGLNQFQIKSKATKEKDETDLENHFKALIKVAKDSGKKDEEKSLENEYQRQKLAPVEFKNYPEIVHFADIFGIAEPNDNFNDAMLITLINEFKEEKRRHQGSFFQEADFEGEEKFTAFQKGFLKNFVMAQINKMASGNHNYIRNAAFEVFVDKMKEMLNTYDEIKESRFKKFFSDEGKNTVSSFIVI